MIKKLSSEAFAIEQMAEEVWKQIQILDESIVKYIDNRADEAISYRGYFDKRFPLLAEQFKGIHKGIGQLIETEGE